MPALEITVDGVNIATVGTEGLDVLSSRIGGTQIDEDLASLNVSGGNYPEDGPSTFLTWVDFLELHAGQLIRVAFHESGHSNQKGKTIEELFSDEPPSEQTDFTLTAEQFKELRAKPKVRKNFSFKLTSSSGASYIGETLPNEHGFGFSVLWNSFHPEHASVSLYAYTLDNLETHSPSHYLLKEKISYGDSIEFHVA